MGVVWLIMNKLKKYVFGLCNELFNMLLEIVDCFESLFFVCWKKMMIDFYYVGVLLNFYLVNNKEI